MWKKITSTALALIMALSLVTFAGPAADAETLSWEDLYYEVSDGNATITGYFGTDRDLTIPAALDEYPVTAIGNSAFYGAGFESVIIPDSVTSIGGWAFSECTSLVNITIPDSVTSIDEGTFFYCTSLTDLTIPDSVTSIGERAFIRCTSLTELTIPDSVTSIGENAFTGCTSLTGIAIPDSVTSIGDYLFNSCYALTSVTIPDSVTSIGNFAFYGCTSLTGIAIPDSVTSIGDYAFSDCTSLTGIAIPGSVTAIGMDAFSSCTALTDFTLSDGVTSIGSFAFYNCTALESITIPGSVIAIDDWVFAGCTALTGISVEADNPNYLSTDGVLFNKAETTLLQYPGGKEGTYTIPDSVTAIEKGAFSMAAALTELTIPGSVMSIGNNALSDCAALTGISVDENNANYASIDGVLFNKTETTLLRYPGGKTGAYTIPDSVTAIGDWAMSDCAALESLTISDSVTIIGEGAFSGCSALTGLIIPGSVTTIGEWAFEECTALTSISIPGSVTAISNWTFNRCSALTDFSVDAANPNYASVDGVLFNKDKTALLRYPGGKTGAYTIPDGVKSISEDAFASCYALKSVTIPKDVTSIGADAFFDCPDLVISCYSGSAAHSYAQEKDILVTLLSDTFTVTFNKGNGDGGWDALTIKSGSTVSITKAITQAFTRKEYVFAHFLGSDGKTYTAGKKITVTSDFTLTAKYNKVKVNKGTTPRLTKESGKIRVRYDKVSGAAGYQFVVSTSKTFASGKGGSKSYVGYKKNYIPSCAGQKLKSGTTYYVKIRAYKLDSKDNKVWGVYSAVTSIKF